MSGKPDRPQYHLLPKDDPARVVEILRAAAGLGANQQDPDGPEFGGAESGPA